MKSKKYDFKNVLIFFIIAAAIAVISFTIYATQSIKTTNSHAFEGMRLRIPFGKYRLNTLSVKSVQEVGEVGKPPNVTTRDGGISVKLGNTLVWIFNDTLFNPKSSDGQNARSNTAAFANLATPLAVEESLDAAGAPYQFIELKQDEKNYNLQKNKGDDRYALWPMSAVNISDDEALIFLLSLKVQPGYLNYDLQGVNIASMKKSATDANIIAENVFKKPEELFVRSALKDGQYIYLYSCDKTKFGCEITRVPQDKVTQRSAYTFWNGKKWVSDINAAKKVIDASSSGFSVAWNNYLNQFVAVYSKPFANEVLVRTASRPEGPWSSQKTLFTGLTPTEQSFDYAAQQHPALFKENGKKMYISYYRPLGPFTGELRLVEVSLK